MSMALDSRLPFSRLPQLLSFGLELDRKTTRRAISRRAKAMNCTEYLHPKSQAMQSDSLHKQRDHTVRRTC